MDAIKYRDIILNKWKLKYMLWRRLPSLLFWGVSVENLTKEKSAVIIKHNNFNKNPFKSIYFSALMGTAEFSTGILAQQTVMDLGRFSMLVVNAEAEFLKKATGKITFHCDQGREVFELLSELRTNETASLLMESEGYNEDNVLVMRAKFNWSFKRK